MQKTLCDTSTWNEVISTLKREALSLTSGEGLRTLSWKTVKCFNAEMFETSDAEMNLKK